MATFVVSLGFKPSDYWGMTLAERDAIVNELNRQAVKR